MRTKTDKCSHGFLKNHMTLVTITWHQNKSASVNNYYLWKAVIVLSCVLSHDPSILKIIFHTLCHPFWFLEAIGIKAK